MIDTLYCRYSLKKEKPLDPSYKPTDAIQGRQHINEQAPKLAVIFPGWHNHPQKLPVSRLVKRLQHRGWSVLIYDFHDQILQPDDETVVESFRYIQDTIASDLAKLVSDQAYSEVRLISISMGGVVLALVADRFSHFTAATAVVGGDNLAIDMWYGLRTEGYAEQFRKMHIGVRRLAHDWETVAPEAHLRHFTGKPVKLVIAKYDKFVLTKYQIRLQRKLVEVGAEVKVKKHRLGHTMTVLIFCLFGSPL